MGYYETDPTWGRSGDGPSPEQFTELDRVRAAYRAAIDGHRVAITAAIVERGANPADIDARWTMMVERAIRGGQRNLPPRGSEPFVMSGKGWELGLRLCEDRPTGNHPAWWSLGDWGPKYTPTAHPETLTLIVRANKGWSGVTIWSAILPDPR